MSGICAKMYQTEVGFCACYLVPLGSSSRERVNRDGENKISRSRKVGPLARDGETDGEGRILREDRTDDEVNVLTNLLGGGAMRTRERQKQVLS